MLDWYKGFLKNWEKKAVSKLSWNLKKLKCYPYYLSASFIIMEYDFFN